MKKGIALLVAAALMLTGCGSSSASTGAAEPAEPANEVVEETQTEDQTEEGQAEETQTKEAGTEAGPAEQVEADGAEAAATTAGTETESSSDTLVIYFSRTGEQYVVGVIDKGNTAIVAEMIAEQTGADLFEVLPAEDHYPMTYDELTEVAKQEQNENARPAYSGELPDLSGYSTIFIGAPVWWGDWPMIMYTVFENNDFSGKTLIPFSTHEGSGLSGFGQKASGCLPGCNCRKGLGCPRQ